MDCGFLPVCTQASMHLHCIEWRFSETRGVSTKFRVLNISNLQRNIYFRDICYNMPETTG
jgi:hypothetical protein